MATITTIHTSETEITTPSQAYTAPTTPTSPSTDHDNGHSIELRALASFDRYSEAPADAATAFPDGGLHAWLVVLGAFFILASTFGLMTSVGILQSYWSQHQLSPYTDSEIGWIPSVFVFISLFLGVQFGPLFDRYGPRWINIIASAGYVICLVLLAECREYWHFMLTLGILGGICCAALTTTGLAVLSHWFRMRRGLANGIAMAGSSCGGIALPLILRSALDDLGWRWSMRLIALVALILTSIANLLIRGRLPVGKRSGAMDPRCLKDARLAWVTVGTFCKFPLYNLYLIRYPRQCPRSSCKILTSIGLEFTLFGALGLLPTYAIGQGFSNQTAFIIIAVLNAYAYLGCCRS